MTKTGIFTGISNADYHAGREVSKSTLDKVRRSLYHYFSLTFAENVRHETASMSLGTAAHAAILEPEVFAATYAVSPGGVSVPDDVATETEFREMYAPAPKFDRRTTTGKTAFAAWEAENPGKKTFDFGSFETVAGMIGKKIFSEEKHAEILAIRDNVLKHEIASKILASGASEASVYWSDEATGRACRCRPDRMNEAVGIIADVKTTADANPAKFWRSVWDYRYHVQAAFYLDGVSQARKQAGLPAIDFVFCIIAVETSFPYAVCVYEFDAELIEAGRREYREDLAALLEAEKTGKFHAWHDKIHTLTLPPWKRSGGVVIQEAVTQNPFA